MINATTLRPGLDVTGLTAVLIARIATMKWITEDAVIAELSLSEATIVRRDSGRRSGLVAFVDEWWMVDGGVWRLRSDGRVVCDCVILKKLP